MLAGSVFKGAVGFLGAIGVWEVARASGVVDSRALPSISSIFSAMVSGLAQGELSSALTSTLTTWFLGLLLASVIGAAIGIALSLFPAVERISRPLIEFLRPIPSVALIPVALLILGIGLPMQLFMIVFASIWPVIFSTKAGVEGVDPRYFETGRVFGLSKLERVFRVVLPATLPSIATGVRTASAIALVLAITVEMLVGRPGIGSYLENVRLNGLVIEMWGAILLTGIVGNLVNSIFLIAERWLIPWSTDNRA